jgi:hypothetical protein
MYRKSEKGKKMVIAVYNHPENGLHPCEGLEEGKEYIVTDVSMGQFYTSIFLDGFSKCFNSVNFDFFEDGKPLNIYRDARFNPYMKRKGF